MKRFGWTWVVALAALLAACEARAPTERVEPEPSVEPEADSVTLSPSERLDRIRTELAEVTSQMNEAGGYNCCVHPVCSWCALHEGTCTCFVNLQGGEEVCPGCGLGWHNGEGIVENVDPSEVKWNITHEHPASGGHAH